MTVTNFDEMMEWIECLVTAAAFYFIICDHKDELKE